MLIITRSYEVYIWKKKSWKVPGKSWKPAVELDGLTNWLSWLTTLLYQLADVEAGKTWYLTITTVVSHVVNDCEDTTVTVMVFWWATSSGGRLRPVVITMRWWSRERQVLPGQFSPPRSFNSSRESLTTTGTTDSTDTRLEVETVTGNHPILYSTREDRSKSGPLLKDVVDWYWFMSYWRMTHNKIVISQLDGY